MSAIQPKGEKVRKAVRWISETKKDHPERSFGSLIQEASLTFNLSPKEEAFLADFYQSA